MPLLFRICFNLPLGKLSKSSRKTPKSKSVSHGSGPLYRNAPHKLQKEYYEYKAWFLIDLSHNDVMRIQDGTRNLICSGKMLSQSYLV